MACLIFSTGTLSSLIGLLHWIRPPTSLRGIVLLLGNLAGAGPAANRKGRPLAGRSVSRDGAGWTTGRAAYTQFGASRAARMRDEMPVARARQPRDGSRWPRVPHRSTRPDRRSP